MIDLPPDVRVSELVGYATGQIARQANCGLIEAFGLLRARAHEMDQSLDFTALDVIDGEIVFG